MNILLLTNMYPHEQDNNPDITKVCAYFAREWVRQGHNVVVIVNSSAFPKIYYFFGEYMKKFVLGHYGITTAPNSMWRRPFEFDDQGVKVFNMPMIKFIPKGHFGETTFRNQVKKIIDRLEKFGFVPDVITGHWANPQVRLVSDLAAYYKAKSALVLHTDHSRELCERYKVNDYTDKIDRIGFRSKSALERASGYLDFKNDPFVCYSGIPEQFALKSIDINDKKFDSDKITLITASRLLDWKHIDSVIDAAGKVLKDVNFSYDIVGDGPMRESLENQVKATGISDKIHFWGQISRDDVQTKMAESEIYVMISKETFGLVYLEAMLQGCIVIAARFGGIDGIVVDGENGFLCEVGNADELAEILKKILRMSTEEKKKIAQKAIETAKKFTDSRVAEMYLESITKQAGENNG